MTWIMVDVEADGPCPGIYSMVELGYAVIKDSTIIESNYWLVKAVTDNFQEEALKVTSRSRAFTLANGQPPEEVMRVFASVVERYKRPMFISDNNGFDWQFVNYYFWKYVGYNPFGHSSTNLGSFYKGYTGGLFRSFRHLRDTPHTHNSEDDARGNAEAFIKIMKAIKDGKRI